MAKKNNTIEIENWENLRKDLDLLGKELSQPYVVEDLKTGKKKIVPKYAVNNYKYLQDLRDPWNLEYPKLNPDVKVYPLKDLGPAAEILFGKKDDEPT